VCCRQSAPLGVLSIAFYVAKLQWAESRHAPAASPQCMQPHAVLRILMAKYRAYMLIPMNSTMMGSLPQMCLSMVQLPPHAATEAINSNITTTLQLTTLSGRSLAQHLAMTAMFIDKARLSSAGGKHKCPPLAAPRDLALFSPRLAEASPMPPTEMQAIRSEQRAMFRRGVCP
jgi:hypothetical protein